MDQGPMAVFCYPYGFGILNFGGWFSVFSPSLKPAAEINGALRRLSTVRCRIAFMLALQPTIAFRGGS
jgi:hypothetical protein